MRDNASACAGTASHHPQLPKPRPSQNLKVAHQGPSALKSLQQEMVLSQVYVVLLGGRQLYRAATAAFRDDADCVLENVQRPRESQRTDELADAVHGLWDALQKDRDRARRLDDAVPATQAPQTGSLAASASNRALESAAALPAVPPDEPAASEVEDHLKDLHEQIEDAIAEKGFEAREFIQNEISAAVF
ncbi:hypothetical protein CGC21_4365 [Leishmania donovani]|uniref:Uncharacterized protein n=1 Tax=Leishmania donovani TaxID=5661 RepID=A0A504XTG2_LEIDO|nr:hypothetical protein CGC21_4365 [Leishmania donovani]